MSTPSISRQVVFGLCQAYRANIQTLREVTKHLYPWSSVVHVVAPSYEGHGIVAHDVDCPPDKLPVRLCNGNIWWYPLEGITAEPNRKNWEPWVKRMHRSMARIQRRVQKESDAKDGVK